MARKDGRSSADLKEDLLNKPKVYSFFQAIRLLRLFVQPTAPDKSEDWFLHNALRIRPLLSMSFPGTDLYDIQKIPEADHEKYQITATFLGLYGPASPLPTHYTEDLLDEASEDRSVNRDFLDILSNPFYNHFFNIWTKYRWHYKLYEANDEVYYDRLYCLLGLGSDASRKSLPNSRRLLRYIGLFTQLPRSAEGLRTLLSDALGVSELQILPNVKRQVNIPRHQRCYLGRQGCTLGEDLYLGRQVEDRMGKIRIQAGPLDEQQYHELLPPEPRFSEAGTLTAAYIDQPLQTEIELTLKREEAVTMQLGAGKWSMLGYDTWLFSCEKLSEDARVVFQFAS